MFDAELVLQYAGSRREDHVRGGCGNNNEINVGRNDAGGNDGALCRNQREIAGILIVSGIVAFAYPGAGDDPFVVGIDDFFKIVISDDPIRQITAGADNAGINHRCALTLTTMSLHDCGASRPSACRRSISVEINPSRPCSTSDDARSSACENDTMSAEP